MPKQRVGIYVDREDWELIRMEAIGAGVSAGDLLVGVWRRVRDGIKSRSSVGRADEIRSLYAEVRTGDNGLVVKDAPVGERQQFFNPVSKTAQLGKKK
jgi:hypothetical protein